MDRRTFAKVAGLTGALFAAPLPAVATTAASANGNTAGPDQAGGDSWCRDPQHEFRKQLEADGPDPRYAKEMMRYGQFVGSWKLTSTDHQVGKVIAGQAYFGWVMQGRAVQDIWISEDPTDPGFGSTLRVYRPDEGLWRISFHETIGKIAAELESRVVGTDIVESSVWSVGDLQQQWIWSDCGRDHFNWRVQNAQGQVYLSTVGTRVR